MLSCWVIDHCTVSATWNLTDHRREQIKCTNILGYYINWYSQLIQLSLTFFHSHSRPFSPEWSISLWGIIGCCPRRGSSRWWRTQQQVAWRQVAQLVSLQRSLQIAKLGSWAFLHHLFQNNLKNKVKTLTNNSWQVEYTRIERKFTCWVKIPITI